jgi:hypothetical protein
MCVWIVRYTFPGGTSHGDCFGLPGESCGDLGLTFAAAILLMSQHDVEAFKYLGLKNQSCLV